MTSTRRFHSRCQTVGHIPGKASTAVALCQKGVQVDAKGITIDENASIRLRIYRMDGDVIRRVEFFIILICKVIRCILFRFISGRIHERGADRGEEQAAHGSGTYRRLQLAGIYQFHRKSLARHLSCRMNILEEYLILWI